MIKRIIGIVPISPTPEKTDFSTDKSYCEQCHKSYNELTLYYEEYRKYLCEKCYKKLEKENN